MILLFMYKTLCGALTRGLVSCFFMAGVVMAVLPSCSADRKGGEAKGNPAITVSIPPLAYFAAAIGGDSLEVGVLLESGTDPETFQPGVGAMRELRRSGVFAVTGVLPFEQSLTDGMQGESDVRVVNLSDGVGLMYGTHTHSGCGDGDLNDGHCHDAARAPDPHIWSSYKNARVIARNLFEALEELYPSQSDYYRSRYQVLDSMLCRADSAAAVRLAARPSFLIWHPSLSYFARDYALTQIAVNSENKENSSKGLHRVMERVDSLCPKVFFIAPGTNSGAVKAVADETGLKPVEVDFMSADWEEHMRKIVESLK